MADTTTDYPTIVPLPDMKEDRAAEVADLLVDAVDLHCHSGPAAMPPILDHVDAFRQADEAGFRAPPYTDPHYVGMPHFEVL